MQYSDVYFWEPQLSPHKTPLINSMQDICAPRQVYYIVQSNLGQDRVRQGWNFGTPRKNVKIIISPTSEMVEEIVMASDLYSVHLFAGMHWIPCIVNGLRAVVRHRRHFGLHSEPRVFEGMGGGARLAHSWLTEYELRRHADFVLAIGRHGPDWFRWSGYPERRIFPFAYFIENNAASPQLHYGPPVVAYVGRLERLKGFHIFLEALGLIKSNIEIRIAGYGTLEREARMLFETGNHRGTFYGAVPMERMNEFYENVDILVLPSITKDDGWGAVVSEALLHGAAVVASDRVGASLCIRDDSFGRCIPHGRPEALAAAVDDIVKKEQISLTFKTRRAKWAACHLDGASGAAYLQSIFTHVYGGAPRPLAFVDL